MRSTGGLSVDTQTPTGSDRIKDPRSCAHSAGGLAPVGSDPGLSDQNRLRLKNAGSCGLRLQSECMLRLVGTVSGGLEFDYVGLGLCQVRDDGDDGEEEAGADDGCSESESAVVLRSGEVVAN